MTFGLGNARPNGRAVYMFLGTDGDGVVLEIGVVVEDATITVIHVDQARPRFLKIHNRAIT